MTTFIDTDRISVELRKRGIDVPNRKLLITRYAGSEQAKDLSEPPNCDGLGRIRHFARSRSGVPWTNPLPLDPAQHALRLHRTDHVRAQVFQNAVCNWRCWYCYVDFELLSANLNHARWASADELIALFLRDSNRASIIDLTGGQPDLTPEWIVWMMTALENAGLANLVYLWSDDNLSNDYLWKYLTPHDLEKLRSYTNYGRVACFKGIDAESFAFNTLADPALFERQFELFERLTRLEIDLYAYVTFTVPSTTSISSKMHSFMDRLQSIHENLPLRTVPLRIQGLTPTLGRMKQEHSNSMQHQETAIHIWNEEISKRFSSSHISQHISTISLAKR